MKAIHSMVAVAAITFGLMAPASAATTDPEVIIYRFPGVRDNGGGPIPGWRPSFTARTSVVWTKRCDL